MYVPKTALVHKCSLKTLSNALFFSKYEACQIFSVSFWFWRKKIDFKKEIICIFYKFIYKYSLMFILEINIRGYLSYVRKDMLVWLSNPLLNQMKNSEKSYISSFKRTFLWQFIIEKTIYEWMNSILIRIPSTFGEIRKSSISKSSQIPTL